MDNQLMVEKLSETFQIFTEFNDKEFKQNYSDLNINEVHTIDYIGKNQKANVTKITNHLKITKGGVTKITKKLINKEYIRSYKLPDNKKEKYFDLTNKGTAIFTKHEYLHSKSIERDKKIFEFFNEEEKQVIATFLDILKNDLKDKY